VVHATQEEEEEKMFFNEMQR